MQPAQASPCEWVCMGTIVRPSVTHAAVMTVKSVSTAVSNCEAMLPWALGAADSVRDASACKWVRAASSGRYNVMPVKCVSAVVCTCTAVLPWTVCAACSVRYVS
jgi:hypothetical protein